MNVLDSATVQEGSPGSQAPPARKRGVYPTLARWLAAPRADRVIVILGFVLLLPSLDTGLAADDYLQTLMQDRPTPLPGFGRSPVDIFRFCDPREFPALLAQGLFSWWDDPNARLAFMRPLSSLTHVFDHTLFRNHGPLMHLHSAVWTLLLLLGVRTLYRALILDRFVAYLALALYALDDARGWLVAWVAARNAAVATAISVWCLVAHHSTRSGRLPKWAVGGPLLLLLALLSGEGSLATCGYLLGYALFLDRAPVRARLLSLVPYVVVLAGWQLVYHSLGYGQYGSSVYVHPIMEPLAYLSSLVQNGPMLLAAQFGGVWSDVSLIVFAVPRVKWLLFAASCVFVGLLFWLMRESLRQSTLARFALVGMLVSLGTAVTCTVPMDRLLTWIAIGASILLAQLIAPVLRESLEKTPRDAAVISRAQRLAVALLVGVHVVSVVFLPSRARGNLVMRDTIGRADAGIPRDPSIVDKTLIFMNPPLLPYAAYMPIERAAQGIPRPRALHILAIATTEIDVDRPDDRTLRLRPRDGFLLDTASRLLWSEHRPFHVGEQIVQGDMTVTVLRAADDGRPLEIETRFARSLDDPSYVWVDWRGTRSVPFTPPPIGGHVQLPAADYLESVLGVKLPFEARL
ncbi:MAG: hypothetical protein ABW321_09765 [Polyangiales bacterium]